MKIQQFILNRTELKILDFIEILTTKQKSLRMLSSIKVLMCICASDSITKLLSSQYLSLNHHLQVTLMFFFHGFFIFPTALGIKKSSGYSPPTSTILEHGNILLIKQI